MIPVNRNEIQTNKWRGCMVVETKTKNNTASATIKE